MVLGACLMAHTTESQQGSLERQLQDDDPYIHKDPWRCRRLDTPNKLQMVPKREYGPVHSILVASQRPRYLETRTDVGVLPFLS